MQYIVDEPLRHFKFWDGAKDTVSHLSEEDLDTIEQHLEECYPDGDITDTQINSIFWVEEDFIARCLGFENWTQFLESKKETETEGDD